MPSDRLTINVPAPEEQLGFAKLLATAKGRFLQQALLVTLSECDIAALDREASQYVAADSLRRLAGLGLRAELVFCLPTVLRANPRLLGYYRLLLGFSRKAFYSPTVGLSAKAFTDMETEGRLAPEADQALEDLCRGLNRSASMLLEGLPPECMTHQHLHELTLLTLGPQFRGGYNVSIGAGAVEHVFSLMKEIVGTHATDVQTRRITMTDATGRQIVIRSGADPDIEVMSVGQGARADMPLLAIEVKGGTDRSNVHNRLGEAEKSHLKAKARGHTDMWTITNVEGLSEADRRAESPTTTAFFNLEGLVTRQGAEYEEFRERLLQKLRLPEG